MAAAWGRYSGVSVFGGRNSREVVGYGVRRSAGLVSCFFRSASTPYRARLRPPYVPALRSARPPKSSRPASLCCFHHPDFRHDDGRVESPLSSLSMPSYLPRWFACISHGHMSENIVNSILPASLCWSRSIICVLHVFAPLIPFHP